MKKIAKKQAHSVKYKAQVICNYKTSTVYQCLYGIAEIHHGIQEEWP